MKKDLLIASVLAAVIAVPAAYAETSSGNAAYSTKKESKGIIKQLEERKQTATDTVKAFVMGENGTTADPITIHYSRTADGMIGQPILNPAGERIAKVKDIILNGDRASQVIVTDGGVLGIGNKLAAFEYGRVVTQQDDGKVVMALSQDMIDSASDFSYDPEDQKTANILPASGVSVNDVLDGDLLNSKGDKVGSVDNISFSSNGVEHVIVRFNKKLGLGGDLAALDFDALDVVKKDGSVNLRMDEAQSQRFARLQKTAQK